MSRSLGFYDYTSIVSIILYTIFLAGAIYLCIKHGFKKSSGWRFLVVLALARIIGSGLYLGTIADPTNVSLYIGWLTCNGLGLGPLILLLLGLLDRVYTSVNRDGNMVARPIFRRGIELLMLVAIILTIVGGTQSNYNTANGTTQVDYATISKVGNVLMIIVMAMLFFMTFVAFRSQGYLAQGEHRVILVVVACLPFVLVRLIYSVILILGGVSTTKVLYLVMEVVMELVVVVLTLGLGFTLSKVVEPPSDNDAEMHRMGKPGPQYAEAGPQYGQPAAQYGTPQGLERY